MPTDPPPRTSLRAEQVAQTQAALVAAGRALFGRQGFADTSVEELARRARVTIGALYHHFSTKTALFEHVFLAVHGELLERSVTRAEEAANELEVLLAGFDAFLDGVLDPEVQRIVIVDAPAVLGLERFTELDERYALGPTIEILEAATAAGLLRVEHPGIVARLLLGALTRGAVLIAGSPDPAATRDEVATSVRALIGGLA